MFARTIYKVEEHLVPLCRTKQIFVGNVTTWWQIAFYTAIDAEVIPTFCEPWSGLSVMIDAWSTRCLSTSIVIILVLLNAFYDTGANHGHSSNFQFSIPSINSRNHGRLQVEELKCNHLNRILIFIRRVNDSVCGLWRKHIYNLLLLVHTFLCIWSLQLPAAPLRYFNKNYKSEKLEPLLAKSFEPFNNPFCRCFLRPAY